MCSSPDPLTSFGSATYQRGDTVSMDDVQYRLIPGDVINHPAHYTAGKAEVIDFIEDQQLPYHLGNVIKYVARHARKGKPLEDLKKAQWYLNRYISNLESK